MKNELLSISCKIDNDTKVVLRTGGKALFDNNDLSMGIVNAQRAVTDYYIVGYYTTNAAQNGRFRSVKISTDPSLSAVLDYREGYFAQKEFAKFTTLDRERQLEDALMLGDPITELSVSMEIDYFQINRAEYYVPIAIKIPGRELALAKRLGAEHTLLDFICEIKDLDTGSTVQNLRDNIDIKLSAATAAELAMRPIIYDAGFTLMPGKYAIKFLARDDETGRIGTYQTTFIIPNLNNETKRIPISSVVLSSQRVKSTDALFHAAANTKQELRDDAKNPLVSRDGKLIPSVTRVFDSSQPLYVYLQAYAGQPRPSSTPPVPSSTRNLLAYVTLFKNHTRVYESAPIVAAPSSASRLGAAQISFSLLLDDFAPGEYQCQIAVLDPVGSRVAFWVGPLELVQK